MVYYESAIGAVPEGRVLLVQAQAVDVDKVASQQRGEGRRH